MAIWKHGRYVAFRRNVVAGAYARKINLKMSWEWLARNGMNLENDVRFQHLKRHEWDVGTDMAQALERLVRIAGRAEPLNKLEMEAAALRLVCSTFARLNGGCGTAGRLNGSDMRKLDRMEQFIHQHCGPVTGKMCLDGTRDSVPSRLVTAGMRQIYMAVAVTIGIGRSRFDGATAPLPRLFRRAEHELI